MFDKVILRRSTERRPLTAGELAEALLFYQNVHILFDYTLLGNLSRSIGISNLMEVITRPNISSEFCEGTLATMTNTVGGVQIHDLISIHPAVDQKERRSIKSKTGQLKFLLEHRGGCGRSDARKYAQLLRAHLPFRSYNNDDFVKGGVFEPAREDVLDQSYIYESVRRSIQALIPRIGPLPMFRFRVIKVDGGFAVDTDLDFDRINGMLSLDVTRDLKVTPALLLDIIFSARADLTLAAHYGSEFRTWSLVSEIVRLRYASLLQSASRNLDEVAVFQEIVFPEGRTIREAIDSGERKFDEFLVVLDEASKFREWVKDIGPDGKLAGEYLRAVTAQGWIDSLPAKVIRYMVVLAGGVIEQAAIGSTVLGPTLGAADQFVLQSVLAGWRPNHFVDTELRPFVREG